MRNRILLGKVILLGITSKNGILLRKRILSRSVAPYNTFFSFSVQMVKEKERVMVLVVQKILVGQMLILLKKVRDGPFCILDEKR